MPDVAALKYEWSEDLDDLKRMGEEFSRSEETSLIDLSSFWDWDYEIVVKVARDFDAWGFAKFIVGRKGKESRIRWKVDPQEIFKIAASAGDLLTGKQKTTTVSWDEMLEILASSKGCHPANILLDVKVGPLRRNLARVHQIDERDVDVRIGM